MALPSLLTLAVGRDFAEKLPLTPNQHQVPNDICCLGNTQIVKLGRMAILKAHTGEQKIESGQTSSVLSINDDDIVGGPLIQKGALIPSSLFLNGI